MTLLFVFIGIVYCLLIGLFFIGWKRFSIWQPCKIKEPIRVSVIIPFRNEEATLHILLNSLKNQDYPENKIEIIAVNDHSSDKSCSLLEHFIHPGLIKLNVPENLSGKKTALLTGTKAATGELIITTDADCQPGKLWLQTLVSYYQHHKPKMMVAPVVMHPTGNLFDKFQILEFLSLQGSTAGAISIGKPIMCNGANLAYSKDILPVVQTTYEKSETPSGDDIFALLAVHKNYPGEIHYVKAIDASTIIFPEKTIRNFFIQRKRWTSKAKFYNDFFLIFTASVILITSLSLIFSLISGLISGNWYNFFILFLLKCIIDFPFLKSVSDFFGYKKLLQWFLLFQSFYFLYISFTFINSCIGGYSWKSRKIRT